MAAARRPMPSHRPEAVSSILCWPAPYQRHGVLERPPLLEVVRVLVQLAEDGLASSSPTEC
jgi:hypothetical protein